VRIVSDQSEDDIRRRETRDGLVWPLRELAANILRIVNGAGKPWELMNQLAACHEALRLYAEAHSMLPSEFEIHQILDCDLAWQEIRPGAEERQATETESPSRMRDDGEIEREMALGLIRKGALQMVASRLLRQVPQQGRAGHDLHSGIHMLREANAKRDAYYAKNKTTLAEALAMLKAKTGKPARKKNPPGGEPGGRK
jgi:hypothetical protein